MVFSPAPPRDVPPVTDAPAPAAGSAVDSMLDLVRTQLGLEVAFVTEFQGEQNLFRNLRSTIELPIEAGATIPYLGSFCQMITEGMIDQVTPDCSLDELARAAPATTAFGIGCYVGVPILAADGGLYGTLCGYSRTADPTMRQRDADVVRAVAEVVGTLIRSEDEVSARSRDTEHALNTLVERGGMSMVYQPVVNLRTDERIGVEALSRFPDGVAPDLWFDNARHVGRGVELELMAVGKALAELDRVPGFVGVNLSPEALCDKRFAALLAGVDISRVTVEITEHEEIQDYARVVAAIEPFRREGLQIAIDDAGAGFASMRHILLLEPDIIKLDGSLVRGIGDDPRRQAFAEALAGFAAKIDAWALAECIETADDFTWVCELGIPLGQGYYLGRPAPLD